MDDRAALEIEKLRAEISHLTAQTEKTYSEMRKMERERFFYPLVVGTGFLIAVIGVVRALM